MKNTLKSVPSDLVPASTAQRVMVLT